MERRKFLKAIIIGTTFLSVPSIVLKEVKLSKARKQFSFTLPKDFDNEYIDNEIRRFEDKIKGDLIKIEKGYNNDDFILDRFTIILVFED